MCVIVIAVTCKVSQMTYFFKLLKTSYNVIKHSLLYSTLQHSTPYMIHRNLSDKNNRTTLTCFIVSFMSSSYGFILKATIQFKTIRLSLLVFHFIFPFMNFGPVSWLCFSSRWLHFKK